MNDDDGEPLSSNFFRLPMAVAKDMTRPIAAYRSFHFDKQRFRLG
jgi:hypothetical protein